MSIEAEKQEPLAWMSPSGQLYRTRWEAIENGEQMVTPLYARPVVHAVRCTYPQCQATNGCVGACSKEQFKVKE
jgi:hypothetical protein